MKFTKLTLVALLLALFVCAFVACGGGKDTETNAPETNAPETNAPDTNAPETDPPETEHVHDIEVQIIPATCTERGYEKEVCKTCEEVVSTKPIKEIDHTPVAAATCTDDSVCSVCQTVITPALGHSYGEGVVTTEATCAAAGAMTKTCATCQGTVVEPIAKLKHTIATPTETKAATISTAGYEKGACSLCGAEAMNILPAGITLNIEALADGILPDGFTATSGFELFYGTIDEPTTATIAEKTEKEGVPYVAAPGDWVSVVTDPATGNKYITKTEGTPVDAGINFIDSTGILNGNKFEISFDYRMETAANNGGLLALNNREVDVTDEMRLLSVWSGNKVVFAANSSLTLYTYDITNPEWVNYRVVVDGATYDYEVYVNGEKMIYTVTDEAGSDGHVVYYLKNGEWTANKGSFGNQSPFKNVSGIISSIYMFHYNKPAGSLDNLKVKISVAETFDGLAEGVAATEALTANSVYAAEGVEVTNNKGTLIAAVENGNTFIKKPGDNDQLYFKKTDMLKGANKVEFAFDFRLDAEFTGLCGLFSLMNEMRILNVNKNGIEFGINANGIVRVADLEVGKWTNVKVVVDTTTYDYEIYVDGTKLLYTTADPENAGKHLVYKLTDGAYVVTAPQNNDVLHGDRSPFTAKGDYINQFYFWHYSANLVCSLDNVSVNVLG